MHSNMSQSCCSLPGVFERDRERGVLHAPGGQDDFARDVRQTEVLQNVYLFIYLSIYLSIYLFIHFILQPEAELYKNAYVNKGNYSV
jgi:hypothetical protein